MQFRETLILIQNQSSHCQIFVGFRQVKTERFVDFLNLQTAGQYIFMLVYLLADIGSVIMFVFYITEDFFYQILQLRWMN